MDRQDHKPTGPQPTKDVGHDLAQRHIGAIAERFYANLPLPPLPAERSDYVPAAMELMRRLGTPEETLREIQAGRIPPQGNPDHISITLLTRQLNRLTDRLVARHQDGEE